MVSMTLREVYYLSETVELKHLVNNNNLNLKVVDNEKIYLKSKCYIFEIYGLVVEDFFYFDLYSIDLDFYSSLDRVLSDFDSGIVHSVNQKQIAARKKVLISCLQGNKDSTLKAEQYFFSMLQLMDEILTEIMSCKKEIGKQYWTRTFNQKRKELESVLKAF
jgi:hypothetical protein